MSALRALLDAAEACADAEDATAPEATARAGHPRPDLAAAADLGDAIAALRAAARGWTRAVRSESGRPGDAPVPLPRDLDARLAALAAASGSTRAEALAAAVALGLPPLERAREASAARAADELRAAGGWP